MNLQKSLLLLAFVAAQRPSYSGPSAWSLLIGTSGIQETGNASCVDKDGNIILTGSTGRTGFPTTSGAYQKAPPTTLGPATIFITKISPDHKIIFSTYLSGSSSDVAKSVAVDRDGNIFVAGQTMSTDFPVTTAAFQRSPGADIQNTDDGFVAKISADGSRLLYSTYFGGDNADSIEALAVDAQGRAYIAGSTSSSNFPLKGTLSQSNSGTAFVARLSSDGSAIDFSARFGGGGTSEVKSIALEADGTAQLAGSTDSLDFPAANPVQTRLANVTVYRYDGGLNWVPLPDLGKVSSVAADSARTVYLGTPGGILKSKDGGMTWSARLLPGSNASTTWIDVNPANPNLLMAVSGGIYSSKDAGDTWTRVNDLAPPHVLQVSADGLVVLVDRGLRRSTDGGKTFVDLLVTPETTGSSQRIVARDRSASDAVFVDAGGGTYRVSAGGTNIEYLYNSAALLTVDLAQDPSNPKTIYSVAGSVVLKSVNNGKFFSILPARLPAGGPIVRTSEEGNLMVAGESGAARSSDGGVSWQLVNGGLTNRRITMIANVPGTPTWFAVTANGNDGFISSLAPEADRFSFSTTLGGAGSDTIRAIASAGLGRVFVTGTTTSTNLQTTPGALQVQLTASRSAFGAMLDTKAGTLQAMTYLGFAGFEPFAAAVNSKGEPLFAGWSYGAGFPQTDSLYTGTKSSDGNSPAYVLLNSGLTSVLSASRVGLGGDAMSAGFDPQGRLILGGTGVRIREFTFPLERTYVSTQDQYAPMVTTIDFGGNPPAILTDPSYVRIGEAGGTASVAIQANGAWSASAVVPWVSLENSTGTGTGILRITAAANPSTSPRSTYVNVNGRSILVTQAGAMGVVVAVSGYGTISPAGETITLQLTVAPSDYAWTAVSDVTWASLQGSTSAVGNGSITIRFAPNPLGSDRVAGIRIGTNHVITIVQAGRAGYPGGLWFVPLPAPCRIVDTRLTAGTFGGPSLIADATRDFPIPSGTCGIPANALSYSLNVTVVPKEPLGFLTLWPAGESRPVASTLNSDGRIKANAAIVSGGTNGAISAYVTNPTDLVIDINGYFVLDSGLMFYPVSPCRVTDTRGSFAGAIGAGVTRSFPMAAPACGVPASAKAVSLNVTAIPQGPLGYLTMWPMGQQRPLASTLNSPTGAVVANAAIVPVGTFTSVNVFATATTDVAIDVNGYFDTPSAAGLMFYPVSPCRMVDTRTTFQPMRPGETRRLNAYPYACATTTWTIPHILSLNATVVPKTVLSYLTLGHPDVALPFVSTLNSLDGSIVSNAALVPANYLTVQAYTTHQTELILDLNGFFAP